MADLTAIQTAVYNRLNDDAALSALATGIFDTMAPHETTYPYVIVSIVDATDTPNMDKEVDYARVQIDVYDQGASAATAQSVMDQVDTLLAYQHLAESVPYLEAKCYPEQVRKMREATDIWRLSRDYRIMFERAAGRRK